MSSGATRSIRRLFPILAILLLPVLGSGQERNGVQGEVVALLGVSLGGEERQERIEQEVFVGSPDCGLFEEGVTRLYSLSFDVLMPVGRSSRSGPGFSLLLGLASSSAQVDAPEPYAITTSVGDESGFLELPHSYHLESNSIDVGFDLFWDQYLWQALRLRAGVGASFALPGSTREFNRIDHDVYRFEDGEERRAMPVAGPGFASLRFGPLAGLGYRIELPSGATLEPALLVRMSIDPDDSRLSGFSLGLRLGLHIPIRRPPGPLSASLTIGDRDRLGPTSDSVAGLQLVVLDSYRLVDGEWKEVRRIDAPTLTVAPRWQGAPGDRVEAWSILLRQGEEVLLSADSDDRSPPERIDWKMPAGGWADTVIGLRAELHVRDSLGRDARAAELLPLHIRHLVRFTVQSRDGEVHLLSIPDSALLALRGVAPALAGAILDRLGPADTLYYLSTRPEGRESDSIRVDHLIGVLRPDRRMRPQVRPLIGRGDELVRLFDRKDLPEAGIILFSPTRAPEHSPTPE